MDWHKLINENQLEELLETSQERPQLIYKHSTRCGTSSLIKARLERAPAPDGMDFYFLDLIAYRSLSDKIAQIFGVRHESPQVLLIKNGECVYHESHGAIYMEEIAAGSMRA